jgi:hypothetical protein
LASESREQISCTKECRIRSTAQVKVGGDGIHKISHHQIRSTPQKNAGSDQLHK